MTKIQYINGTPLPWLVSGRLCLDFVNTVEPRDGMAPNRQSKYAEQLPQREYLETYDDLVAWGLHSTALSPEQARASIDLARQQPGAAQAVLAQALALREAIYHIFWMIAHQQAPAADDTRLLFEAVAGASAQLQLAPHGDQIAWQWRASAALDCMLWPVLSDAVVLLVEGDPERIKMCPGVPQAPICGWLFYDGSKNRSRQWCSMEDCGGAAKTRRQNARRRVVRNRQQ